MGNETDCMVGNPGIIAVADAIVKGIPGIDKEKAWNALKTTAMCDDRGQDLRKRFGYIPSDLYNQSVACDMEYAIADGAMASAAEYLGKTEDAKYFRERSHSYRTCGAVSGLYSEKCLPRTGISFASGFEKSIAPANEFLPRVSLTEA